MLAMLVPGENGFMELRENAFMELSCPSTVVQHAVLLYDGRN